MTVLVTGTSGLLGAGVADALLARGTAVRTFQRGASASRSVSGAGEDLRGSVTDPAAVERAVDGVDAVIHLAAKVSLAGDERDFETVNVGGTRLLLDAARRAGVSRFVFVSSPSVAHAGISIVGDDALPADPVRARGPYARTKAAAELAALAADAPGFATVAVRPHLVWGPNDTQLIARIVERARDGRLPLLGAGAALIDTVYRDNAVDAIVAALDRAEVVHGQSFVVTNGEPRTVAELMSSICRAARVQPPRVRVPAGIARFAGGIVEAVWRVAPGEDEPPMTRFLAEQLSTSHWYDQRRTQALLDWTPAVPLDEGFARLADSYRRG